jgi:hypothetical protein
MQNNQRQLTVANLVNALSEVLGLNVRQPLEYPEITLTVVSTLELETNE